LALERAEKAGCEALQIFARNPRGWRTVAIKEAEVEAFKRLRAASGLSPLIVHSPYLINLSSPDPEIYRKSLMGFCDDYRRATRLGAEGYVIHVGFHRGKGSRQGIETMAEALGLVLDEISPPAPVVLLENTASSGSALGHRFSNIADILEKADRDERLGFCLDTCHAFVAGYNVAGKIGLEDALDEIDATIGLERLGLVHFNDARHGLGSHRDGHAHIGAGRIGLEGMRRIFLHPRLSGVTWILETPKERPDDDLRNLSLVRLWRNSVI